MIGKHKETEDRICSILLLEFWANVIRVATVLDIQRMWLKTIGVTKQFCGLGLCKSVGR